jgi:hypothetical protein
MARSTHRETTEAHSPNRGVEPGYWPERGQSVADMLGEDLPEYVAVHDDGTFGFTDD